MLVKYGLVSIVVIFNPIVAWFLDKFLSDGVYWRLFWNIPIGITIAYTFTEIIFSADSRVKKGIVLIVFIGIITYAGEIIYKEDVFTKVNNWYKIPDDELLAIDILLNEKQEQNLEKIKIFVPTEMVAHVRQIDSSILIAYKRSPNSNYSGNTVLNLLNSGDWTNAGEELINWNCNYLVWNRAFSIEEEHYEIMASTENYNIYRIKP